MVKKKQSKEVLRNFLGSIFGFQVNKIAIIKRVISNPDRARTIVRYAIAHFSGHRDYQKFIILGRARTGSTLLQSLLNGHPEIHAKGEVLTRTYGTSANKVFKNIFSRQPKPIKAVGFKIFYDHPLDDDSEVYWEELAQMKDLQVIHLRRKNILRTLISEKIAIKTNVWGVKKEKSRVNSKRKKVCFSVQELQEEFEKIKLLEQKYQEMFQAHPTLNLYYETFINEPQRDYEKITAMLGLDDMVPAPKLRKQNLEKLSDLVEDYHSIKKTFLKTKWGVYFDE